MLCRLVKNSFFYLFLVCDPGLIRVLDMQNFIFLAIVWKKVVFLSSKVSHCRLDFICQMLSSLSRSWFRCFYRSFSKFKR